MNFDVTVNGKPWKVGIEPATRPGGYTVTVKGKRRELDVSWVDADTLSLIDTQSHVAREIRLTPHAGGVDVAFAGKTFRTVAEKGSAVPVSSPAVTQDGRVIAPMPGRVVRVLVAVGDTVTARQAVVLVEAMKMENELRAPKSGVVTQVLVQEGTAIETGAILVVVQ
jgi:biotin carboxyl carrier protein